MRKAAGGRLECARCGHAIDQGPRGGGARPATATAAAAAAAATAAPQRQASHDFNVLEGSEGQEALPTIEAKCEKCGHGEAVWWMLQTRSADEPTTQFYRCTSCGHTWRNYD